MRVTEPNEGRLILEEKIDNFTYIVALAALISLLVAIIKIAGSGYAAGQQFLIGGACFFSLFYLSYRPGRFDFDRERGEVDWIRGGPFNKKRSIIPLVALETVVIKSDQSSQEEEHYLVFLITIRGELPENPFASNEKQIRITSRSVCREEAEWIANRICDLLGKGHLNLERDGVEKIPPRSDLLGMVSDSMKQDEKSKK